MPKSSSKSPIKEYIRAGFGITLGSMGALVIAMLIGLAFFVPGFILARKELNKQNRQERDTTKLVIGFILMAIGMIFSFGMGGGQFFELLGDAL